ncbi:MAG: recombination protein RecA [Chloroflexi bacterium]|nr:MAG: recombination protein RecA [Chloroflexota bacterium]
MARLNGKPREKKEFTAKLADANDPDALSDVLADIERQFGVGAVMKLGEASKNLQVESISTGALGLDIALGIGGVPRGRIIEIYGPESTGKSTLAQHVIASAQRAGGQAAYIDVEHALDPSFAAGIGINIDELLISQPDTGEQALEITEALIRSNALDVIVVDSVAALVPRAEIEGEMGDAHVGLQARLMSQALRKLTAVTARSRTSLIFINQLREKVGVVFGNPEVTPGGRALKFYSSVRIELRRVEQLKKDQIVIGGRVRAKVVKNKVAPPFRVAEFDIMFTGATRGISYEGDILDLGTENEVIKKAGAFYTYGETRLGQGRENAKVFLIENPEIASQLDTEIREAAGLAPLDSNATADAATPDADAPEVPEQLRAAAGAG